VDPDDYETVYNNTPPRSLGEAAALVRRPAAGRAPPDASATGPETRPNRSSDVPRRKSDLPDSLGRKIRDSYPEFGRSSI
jgi:hypothetical protein